MSKPTVKKVVLAYSGGLDTSVIVLGSRITMAIVKLFASQQI
jgi:argininosuccinate synthase